MKRDGFALPLALVVLIGASLMVTTALQVSMTDFLANRAARVAARSLYAAEAGIQKTVAMWETLPHETLAPGDSIVSGWIPLPDGSVFQTTVMRVDAAVDSRGLFSVVSEGRPFRESTARRQILVMVESTGGGVSCCGAVVSAYGQLDVVTEGSGGGGRGRGRGGASTRVAIDGNDQVPAGWGPYCPAAGPAVGGVRIRRLSDLNMGSDALVVGTPPTAQDASIGTNMVRSFAGTTYDALAAQAGIVYTRNNERLGDVRPRSSGGTCTNHVENWGAPESPGSVCWGRLPVIHARGSLTLEGEGTGQGILLVDGDLNVLGEFRFYGLVVVKGRADWEDESRLYGALLTGNRDMLNQQSRIRDEASLHHSSCALSRALPNSSSNVDFLPGRYWFELP